MESSGNMSRVWPTELKGASRTHRGILLQKTNCLTTNPEHKAGQIILLTPIPKIFRASPEKRFPIQKLPKCRRCTDVSESRNGSMNPYQQTDIKTISYDYFADANFVSLYTVAVTPNVATIYHEALS